MIKLNDRLAAVYNTHMGRGVATLTVYSDAVTDPTTLLTTAIPTANKLIQYATVTLGVNALGFVKIASMTAAAQTAAATAAGTAKWFRLDTQYNGVWVGEIGAGHALRLVNGNAIALNEQKVIQSFAFKIKR